MTLAQLKEAEDEFDEEDIKAIEIYRYSTAVLGRGGGLYVRTWLTGLRRISFMPSLAFLLHDSAV